MNEYFCEDCKQVFTEEECETYQEPSEAWGHTVYEEWLICPVCHANLIKWTEREREKYMSKFKTTQDIYVETEDERVLEYLENEYPDCNWDIYKGRIEGSCEVTGDYTPQVLYTRNGDGNPEIIELDDGFCEDYLEDEIMEKVGVKVKVTTELREWGRDYD